MLGEGWMRLFDRGLTVASAFLLAASPCDGCFAQNSQAQAPSTAATASAQAQAVPGAGASQAGPATQSAQAPAGTQDSAPRKTYTVPAGTKVLLQLRSAINTRSAKPGDGVYLASTFPVVVGNRVMIPA